MKFFNLVLFLLLISCYGIAQDTTKLSMIFIGDIMQHDSQINAAYDSKKKGYDYTDCFQFLKPYLNSADLAIGNLELTLAGPPYKGYPQFSAPDALAVALKGCGMDVLVTANNHSVDRRRSGIERTIRILDSLQILHTGTFADTVNRMNDYPLIIHKNGFKIALLNYTYGTNGIPIPKPTIVNLIDTTVMAKDLAKAIELKVDATIVFMHWGLEYQSLPSTQQKMLAEFCFKKGAKLVIGSHPHVIQPMEWRKEKDQLIVYSLGNFVSGQRDRYKNGGALVRVDLVKTGRPDSTVTSIDSAGYILEWVYRTVDSKKDYYVLPVPTFENDTTNFIKDEYSKKSFQTFIDDSRKLLGRHNVNMIEFKSIPTPIQESTDEQTTDCPKSDRCYLKPDPGMCRAYIIKYYYDQDEKKCKEFVWGGCEGVVPFNTLEECKQCECTQD